MADLAYYLRISNHLAGNLDIKSALRSVKSEIDRILEVDHLDVCLIDDKGYWNTSYEVGLRTSWSRTRAPVEVSPVRDILRGDCDFLLTGNALDDPRYVFDGADCEPILKYNMRSRVNVAMKVLGRTIGALNCSSQKPDFYDQNAVDQVRNIADILAPYFYALRANEQARREAIMRAELQAREEGLRLGALSLTDALELERQTIGMDLHDQTLADMTRISRDLESCKTREDIENLRGSVQNCIQGLREIIDTSIPSLLELFGFQHAVRTHLERAIGADQQIEIDVRDLTHGLIDRLPQAKRIALFRIAQEAINNAVRHAHASRIEVEIECRDGLHLHVRDNGRSKMAVETKQASGGLTHMRTRARLIAAQFDICYDSGTRICVCLPVSECPQSEGVA
ncbi:ATP-binding protein [Ruegeria sp.]|uniref:sensor histidine kinase n=1 Tax=Ruegeria sp. TaxID=1879320 RepID=UPI002314C67D|nr:ATP-binding protein [Ruegeria sp.]MDA7963662.1 sensor histidine kinase [Ruegeria sp.]